MPANVNVSGAQRRLGRQRRVGLGPAAAQVRRHRDVDQLRMRQPEVVHVADEVRLADLAAEARIEAAAPRRRSSP